MLSKDFLEYLEYRMCKEFARSNHEDSRGFWCDGILPSGPEEQYSLKWVNENRKVVLSAYVGKEGQTVYELVLKFGSKALSRYARGLDIKECVPDADKSDWLDIDIKSRIIVIQLD